VEEGFFFQSFFVSLSCFQPSKPPHTKKIEKNSNTVGKATGRVTLALGDEGLLVLVDEAEPPVAVWTSGPHGLKALFESVKSGATHLAERAAYYSSAAYTESKAKSAEIIEKAKTHGEAAYAKVRQSEEGEGFPFSSSSFRIFLRASESRKASEEEKLTLSLPLSLLLFQKQAAEATTKALDVAGDYAGKAKDAAADAAHAATEKAKEVAAKVDAAIH
jgi:hypothetical protein